VRKWRQRFLAEGSGLADRSSRSHRSPTVIARGAAQRVISRRRHRRAMRSIAQTLGIAMAMVSRVLARAGLSRLAAPDVPPPPNRYERVDCAAGFLDHAFAYYRSLGVRVERVLTDNGKVFDSGLFARLCEQHKIKCLQTRNFRPQINGKAEPFVQTALREWA
jgi:hypothetical protein